MFVDRVWFVKENVILFQILKQYYINDIKIIQWQKNSSQVCCQHWFCFMVEQLNTERSITPAVLNLKWKKKPTQKENVIIC